MNEDMLHQSACELLSGKVSTNGCTLDLLKGGKNNRVYRACTGDFQALLKVYFKHPQDNRDRCKTEFSFASFAWNQGIRSIPEPLECNYEKGMALYEFVDGVHLRSEEITEQVVNDALEFFVQLNEKRTVKEASELARASEACFSIHDHLICIEGRVLALIAATDDPEFDPKVKDFVLGQLVPAWMRVKNEVSDRCKKASMDTYRQIPLEGRRLSPSDFGFHNALRRTNGELCFLDFEYAGWDDVAKTICDFFLQPAVPVPFPFFDSSLKRIFADFHDRNSEEFRLLLLFPVYQIKWCCILLNEFLPVGRTRRGFALGTRGNQARIHEQLQLAAASLEKVHLHSSVLPLA